MSELNKKDESQSEHSGSVSELSAVVICATPTKLDIANALHIVSKNMENVGVAMDYFCGFSTYAQHGKEMVGAAGLAKEWEIKVRNDAAWDFVEKYADGGDSCTDCRFSDQSGPGWGHTCTLGDEGEVTQCPALPDIYYPSI
jgi:hypothetical protein